MLFKFSNWSGQRTLIAVFALLACSLSVARLSAQQDPIPPARTPGNVVTNQNTTNGYVRVKASPDECYAGLGKNVRFDFINQANPSQPCAPGKMPKVNQSYVWGTVLDGNIIWFGTTSNGQCITQGGLSRDPSQLTPYETDSWACEFGLSPYSTVNGGQLPPIIGDFRPPRFYMYNRTTRQVTDISPRAPVTAANPLGLDALWLQLRGARAAALVGNYIVVGGPALASDGRLNFFAFDKVQMRWVAKTQITGFDNIRRFVDFNGVLYAGVGRSLDAGGAVVRMVNNFTAIPAPPAPGVIPVCVACFVLQNVGNLDGEGAYLTVHNSRIFITTWPKPGTAGMWMSPVIPAGGLTTANQNTWTKVWKAEDYEPDPVLATSYAGGAIFSWNGYLWWGTMNVPWASTGVWVERYGAPTDPTTSQEVVTKTWRPAVMFRARNFETGMPQVELLYGDAQLWKYNPPAGATPGQFVLVNNTSNLPPVYGRPGFGNPYTNYIWSMNVWNNKLYVGTMDWGYMASKGAAYLPINMALVNLIPLVGQYGADMWVFPNTNSPVIPESDSGFGNYGSYGIRNIIPVDSSRMFLGMANAMNLMTSPTDGRPDGGFELIEVVPRSTGIGR